MSRLHRHQTHHKPGQKSTEEWIGEVLLIMKLKINKKLPKTPTIARPNEMMVDIRRPFVSEIRFMTIRPAKEPNEKID